MLTDSGIYVQDGLKDGLIHSHHKQPYIPLRKGLVGYWSMNGHAKDLSSYRNHGTVYGATLAAGKFGQCYSFDGVDDYIQIGSPPILQINGETTGVTISCWVNINKYPTGVNLMSLFGNGYFANTTGYGFGIYQTNFYFQVRNGANVVDVSYPHNAVVNKWIHLAGTRGNNSTKLYINGLLVNENIGALVTSLPNQVWRIGVNWNTLYWADGKIDKPCVFNYALSQANIRRVMLGLHPII